MKVSDQQDAIRSRIVGNLASKRIWKTSIQTKGGFLIFEKAKEKAYIENILDKNMQSDH